MSSTSLEERRLTLGLGRTFCRTGSIEERGVALHKTLEEQVPGKKVSFFSSSSRVEKLELTASSLRRSTSSLIPWFVYLASSELLQGFS